MAIEDDGETLMFCDYDCYAVWNIWHGIGPCGDVQLYDDRLGGTLRPDGGFRLDQDGVRPDRG